MSNLIKKLVLYSSLSFNPEFEKKMVEDAGFKFEFVEHGDYNRFLDEIKTASGIIVAGTEINRDMIETLTQCEVIVRQGIGYDSIDLEKSREKGITVCNVPDYCIEEVSDYTLGLILTTLRHINSYDNFYKKGISNLNSIHDIMGFPPVRRLSTQTLGIFGLGKIARLIAKKAKPFGFRIIATDPYIDPKIAEEMGVELKSFDEVVKESDIISLNAPLTPETRHQFNLKVFKKMKTNAFVINTSRGPLIKENDLYVALKEGIIAGAALDVTEVEPLPKDSPLRELENIILTPHVAFFTQDSLEDLRRSSCEEAIRVMSGEQPRNKVNK